MPATTFTAAWLKGLKPPKDKDRERWFDYSRLSKGQALVLINYRSGRKKWAVSYYKDGKTQPLLRIGSYSEKTGKDGICLKDADIEAQRQLATLLDNVDPAELQRELKSAPTFEMVAELFLLRHAVTLADSGRKYREIVEREFIPLWKHYKAQDVRRRDVVSLLEGIAERGPVAANRAHAVIRKLFNWAIRRDLLEVNPATNIDRPGGVERSRDRVLSSDEIKKLWAGLDTAAMAEEIKLLLRLMLATGQRKGELRRAGKGEFDLVNNVWTIPAEHVKNGQSHRVPLSPLAAGLARQAFKLHPDSELVFPSPRGGGIMTESAIDRAVRNNVDVFGIDHWTPHDLRRTAASLCAGLGVDRLVIKKILNHVDGDITAVYDRHSYDSEKQKALNKWGRELKSITTAAAS